MSSWESSSKWYDKTVGSKGHYYHQKIVIPKTLDLLALEKGSSLLDLACGQGVLSRHLPQGVTYSGVDASKSLIESAKKQNSSDHVFFFHGDASSPLPLKEKKFTHASIVLALQNMEHPADALKQCAAHLHEGGKLVIVLNHPCFRIPRQSSWGIDEKKKLQYRRLDSYFSTQKIPITTHPSKGARSEKTYSYHHPLTSIADFLREAGFVIDAMEEWLSDKISTGPKAKMENRSRDEFPLFLAIRALKMI